MANDFTGRTVYFHIPLRFRVLYLNDTFFSFSHDNTYENDRSSAAGQDIAED